MKKKFNNDILYGCSGGIGKEVANNLINSKHSEKRFFIYDDTINKNWINTVSVEYLRINMEKDIEIKNHYHLFKGKNRLILASGVRILGDISNKEIEKMFRVNYTSTVNIINTFLDLASPGSVVIVTGSIAARQSDLNELHYGASKAALSAAIACLQKKATEKRISLMELSLGAVNAGMSSDRIDAKSCIDAKELASTICKLSIMDFKSLRIPTMNILRMKY